RRFERGNTSSVPLRRGGANEESGHQEGRPDQDRNGPEFHRIEGEENRREEYEEDSAPSQLFAAAEAEEILLDLLSVAKHQRGQDEKGHRGDEEVLGEG